MRHFLLDTAFFIAAKVIWAVIRPESWLVLGGVIACILLFTGRIFAAKISLVITLAFTFAIAILPLGDLLIQPLESRYQLNPELNYIDGIIVLGGAEDSRLSAYWEQIQLNGAAERVTAALALTKRFPDARVVLSGGSGDWRDALTNDNSGATIVQKLFTELGVPSEQILIDDQSRNTAENARYSLQLAKPEPAQVWILVTSAYHMPRAISSFERAGWAGLIPFPVDFKFGDFADKTGWNLTINLHILNIAVQEYVGMLAYSITNR